MSYDRSASVLRLSVTDRCNLRCRYCMPAQGVPLKRHDELLPLEDLAGLSCWLAAQTGIRRVKLTGGEPLVRRGIADLVHRLATAPEIDEVSATTNAALLPQLASQLREAGLSRVNISLDTLDPIRFTELTRGGRLSDTLSGLDAALQAGFEPIKLNSVLLGASWRRDVPELLDLAARLDIEVRFIELMRTGTEARWASQQLVEVSTVRRRLGLTGAIPRDPAASGPARTEVLTWKGTSVRVGWITPQSHPFCRSCSRLRMDALGNLRRCLMDGATLPLAELRSDRGSEEASRLLACYLDSKRPPAAMASDLPMASVGG